MRSSSGEVRVARQISSSARSRNSRFARAFAAVASAVSPTAQHSTMIGPLNPARFRIVKTPLKSTPPVPNCAKGCAAPKSDVMIHNLDLFLLAVRRGLSHRREILVHLIGTIRPERDHPFGARNAAWSSCVRRLATVSARGMSCLLLSEPMTALSPLPAMAAVSESGTPASRRRR